MIPEKITHDEIRKGDVLRVVEDHDRAGARLSRVETYEGRVLTIHEGAVVLAPVDDPSEPHASVWTTSRPGCTVTLERLVSPTARLVAAFDDVLDLEHYVGLLQRNGYPIAADVMRAAAAVVEEARAK